MSSRSCDRPAGFDRRLDDAVVGKYQMAAIRDEEPSFHRDADLLDRARFLDQSKRIQNDAAADDAPGLR